jgi:glycosyltransferase involved in cell wall biosynthesis
MQNLKKKIVIITNFSHPIYKAGYFNGGIDKHTKDLIDVLCDEYELTVCITSDSEQYQNDCVKYIVIPGLSTEGLVLAGYDKDKTRSLKVVRTAKLNNALKGIQCDLIINQNPGKMAFKHPCITFMHHCANNPISGCMSTSNITTFISMEKYLKKHKYVFVSEYQRQTFTDLIPQIIERINNNEKLKPSLYTSIPKLKNLSFSECSIIHNPLELNTSEDIEYKRDGFIMCGRLNPEKGFDTVIKFFGTTMTTVNLDIWCSTQPGKEKYAEKVIKLAENYSNITLHLNKSNSEFLLALHRKQALIINSIESLSYVGMEAMYSGCKVIHILKDGISPLTEFKTNFVLQISDLHQDYTKVLEFIRTQVPKQEVLEYRIKVSKSEFYKKINDEISDLLKTQKPDNSLTQFFTENK